MKTRFKVTVREIMEHTASVEAESRDEAVALVCEDPATYIEIDGFDCRVFEAVNVQQEE